MSQVDGIMIGRGIFSNPWVFEKNLKSILQMNTKYTYRPFKTVRQRKIF